MKKSKKIIIILLVCTAVFSLVFFAGRSILKNIFPIGYSEYVEKYCKEYKVDKAFMYALIKTESDFKPDAVSSVGAEGLTQILPETKEWLCMRAGGKLNNISLFDSETSVKYGTFLVSLLLEEFGGNYETVAAAYHAGIGIVGKWLENPEYSSDGRSLKKIPYDDTRYYVEKIISTEKIYKSLYHF